MNKQAGFTIIELVVVIALLGILSAVALPRFINVTEKAHNAAVEGAAGGLAAGVALAKAKAVVENANGGSDVVLEGTATVSVNNAGYPTGGVGDGETIQVGDCVDLWDNVLQAGRPVASTSPANGVDVDYRATSPDTDTCIYTYHQQNNGVDRVITYEADTGEVSTSGTN